MSIFAKVRTLRLPAGEYVVFGSGPMEAHGLRPSGDIDIFVTEKLYAVLKRQGWEERAWDAGGHFLEREEFEVVKTWHYDTYDPSIEELMGRAEIIQGIPFAPLSDVLSYKHILNRPKDQADIKLIEQYLASR